VTCREKGKQGDKGKERSGEDHGRCRGSTGHATRLSPVSGLVNTAIPHRTTVADRPTVSGCHCEF
jgi:hypothetical protein